MSTFPKASLVLRAREFAFKAHVGKIRNNKAREPYVYHLEEVARLVELSGGNEVEIAGGWLHDSVEDTAVTMPDITYYFGKEVGRVVLGLTDHPDWLGMPLIERKTLQATRVKDESAFVRRVKLADQISNVRCVSTDWPTKWDGEMCLQYVEGAYRIAIACKGISTYLDEQFAAAHAEALQVHTAA